MDKISLFTYKPGNGIFYSIHAGYKLLALCISTLIIFHVSWIGLCILSIFFITALCINNSNIITIVKEQSFIIWYAIFLLIISIIGTYNIEDTKQYHIKITSFLALYPEKVFPSLLFLWRLCITSMASSLMFKTTSYAQITDVCESLAKKVSLVFPRVNTQLITIIIPLFLMFIPMIFECWIKLEYAWKARGGKNTITKIIVLLPSLISFIMNKALHTYYAIQSRNSY